MLESTLGAVYSSFRAVLDVADHFSRVKATFTDILSSIAVFRCAALLKSCLNVLGKLSIDLVYLCFLVCGWV